MRGQAGEKDGKPGLGEKDGKAGLGEETLLWLGLSLRRVGKGTLAVERPDNKVSSAFERSDLLGLCNSFTSARTLLVNRITPPPACRSSPRWAAGARAFFTRGRTFTENSAVFHFY